VKTIPVTIKDIAKSLNISSSTVSRALRDHPDISTQTKKRINSLAEEMDYYPDSIAQSLKQRRTNLIGVIVPEIKHTFFSAAISGIEEIAYRDGYAIIVSQSNESYSRERVNIRALISKRVAGLLISISQTTEQSDYFKLLERQGIPFVFFDRVLKDVADNYVITNDREASLQVIQYAIDSGYRKIAHFSGYEYTNIGLDRNLGFRDAMVQNNLPVNEDWVIQGGINEAAGYKGLMQLAKANNLPELIYAFTFPVALGIYTAARELGLSIPTDIDVVCFGVGEYNNYLSPTITYMDQPAMEIGSQACELLLRKIADPGIDIPEQMIVPSKLSICETCKKG